MDSTLRFPDLPAAGSVVEFADSRLAGLQWQITSKVVTRQRKITTVGYTLRLLHPVRQAAIPVACLRPGEPLVATQQPPQRAISCPLTVVSVTIEAYSTKNVCQVELNTVTCSSDGSFLPPRQRIIYKLI